jgi:predicted methyltransferase
MHLPTRREIALALAVSLAACGRRGPSAADAPPRGTLGWALAGPWRIEPERDQWRHPLQTLLFWGLAGEMKVLEILPGRGWYTAILAPFLAANSGQLTVASFDSRAGSAAQREVLADWDARFGSDQELFGDIERTAVTRGGGVLARPGSIDLAILANNFHTLMAEGAAERVLGEVFAAMRPGGAFGVEQHRAGSTGLQDTPASSGYVQEAHVRALAHEAGFEFVAASDINANPRDTRDHPFGAWTLPPTLRSSPLGQPDDPLFDTAPFAAIGESDRMTLKFRKPTGPRAAAPADELRP